MKNVLLLSALTAAVALGTFGLSPALATADDHLWYQQFTELLARGRVDLSIPGFHGADFVGVVVYLVTRSPESHVLFQRFCAMLIPLAAYCTGRALFRDARHGLLLAAITALMPYMTYSYITGYTQASNILFFLLAIWGAASRRFWTGLAWAIAITTKPFAVIAAPFVWLYAPPQGGMFPRRYAHLLIGLGLPALYVIAQLTQTGEILVGVHGTTDSLVLWEGPVKILRNAAWGVQALFSVHNYYYANPAITGHWNLLHTTPVLILLGLFALLAPKEYFTEDRRLHRALLIGAAAGFALNAAVSMDNFYMQFLDLLLILAALPVLLRHPLWIPIVLATLHFQWFYFFLDFRDAADMHPIAFAVPVTIDVCAALWCAMHPRTIVKIVRHTIFPNALRPTP